VSPLIRLLALRHLRAAPGRSLLTVLGIVLGVAVVFAVDVVNASVLGSLRKSMADVAGKAQFTLGAGIGVEEDALETVRKVPGVAAAVPIIAATAYDVGSGTQLAVLASDTLSDGAARGYDVTGDDAQIDDVLSFLNDPYGVLVTTGFAKRTGTKVGETLLLETVQGQKPFTVYGTLEPRGPATVYGGDLLLMDVYAAEVAFDRGRRFDRIDVIAEPETDLKQLEARLESALGDKVPVRTPAQRAAESERLLGGFQLALSLASLIAIFVGGFIVYNSLSISVAQRRREIGVLRALGASRRQLRLLFVGEGLLMGVLGSAAGLGFGLLLCHAALDAVAATVSTLYLQVKVDALVVDPNTMALAVGLGVLVAAVASYVPARRASGVDPVSALGGASTVSDVLFSSARASLAAAATTVAAALLVAWAARVWDSTGLSYVVAGLLSLAALFVSPALAQGIGRLAQERARRAGPSVLLGSVGFARDRGRNAIATAALGMALANVVNVDALMDSLESSTDAWIGRSFRADLFVFSGTEVQAKFNRPLPASLRGEFQDLDEVEFVQAFRMVQQRFRDQPFYLMSEDLEGYRRFNELAVAEGDVESALGAIAAGEALAASEAFAHTFSLGLGDEVELETPDGKRKFRIDLIYADYRADIGILMTDREVYERIWRDSQVDLYSVYLSEGASTAGVRERIAKSWGGRYGLLVLGSAKYRGELLGLIQRSMALSRASELVAVVVAVLGIINALMVSVLDRRREIGLLKAVGAVRTQLHRMVLTESLLIATTAALLGVLLGAALSSYMVTEALRLQVGWRLDFHLSPWVILETFAAAAVVAWLAAWAPARWAAGLDVSDALAYE